MIRVALYARVSTLAGQDPEMQLRELREYCERRNLRIVDEYVDKGVSGSRERCFARSLRRLVNALEEFRVLGIDFISLHEGVDTSTPNGRLIFGIFATIAEFERELIRDRVRSGLASARAKGKVLGRPRVLADTARITSLRAQGCSWTAIAVELGIGEGTVKARVRRNERYLTSSSPSVCRRLAVSIIRQRPLCNAPRKFFGWHCRIGVANCCASQFMWAYWKCQNGVCASRATRQLW